MKKIFSFLLLCALTVCLNISAFATGDVRTGTITGGGDLPEDNPTYSTTNDSNVEAPDFVGMAQDGLIDGNVTTDKVIGKLESKGNDVVRILQTVGKYVCIGGFIISCLLLLAGILGNHRLLFAGFVGAIIAGVAYAGIVCGREIVNAIAMWAAS